MSTRLTEKFGGRMAESSTGARGGIPAHHLPPASSPRMDAERMKECVWLHPSHIKPDPDQPRKHFDPVELAGLGESMKSRGVLQPIRVRWDEAQDAWVIVAGERRWRAAMMAGLDRIPALDATDGDPEDVLLDQLIENCQRQDLDPIEQAEGIRGLMARTGWTQDQVGSRLGFSQSKVAKSLRLLELPEAEREAVSRGELTARAAYEMAREQPLPELPPDAPSGEARRLAQRKALKGGRPRSSSRTYAGPEGKGSLTVPRPDAGPKEFEKLLRAMLADLKKAAS